MIVFARFVKQSNQISALMRYKKEGGFKEENLQISTLPLLVRLLLQTDESGAKGQQGQDGQSDARILKVRKDKQADKGQELSLSDARKEVNHDLPGIPVLGQNKETGG